MSPITTIPREILLLIYKANDDIPEILNLSRTNRLFYDIWVQNAPSICRPILSSSLPCYSEAVQLAELLLNPDSSKPGQSTSHARAEVLIRNAQIASITLRLFIAQFVRPWGKLCTIFFAPPRREAPFLSSSECLYFVQAFYLTWLICLCSQDGKYSPIVERVFQDVSPQTFYRIRDMANWLSDVTNPRFRDMWSIIQPDCARETEVFWSRLDTEARAWWGDAARIYYLEAKGMMARKDRIKSTYAEDAPGGTWAWFDEYQDYIWEVGD